MKTFILTLYIIAGGNAYPGYDPTSYPSEQACIQAGEKMAKDLGNGTTFECKEK